MFNIFKSDPIIFKQVTRLLKEQIDESIPNNNSWKKNFGNAFTLGYIFAFSSMLIKSKTKDDAITARGTLKVFNNLFGKKDGIRMIATANAHSNTEEFKNGAEQARLDCVEFIDNGGEKPHSLKDFLISN
jgi:hypothetical protein